MEDPDHLDYATLLASFAKLRRLKLWMKIRDINKIDDKESMIQWTQAAARAWLVRLVERKKGAKFESISARIEIFCDMSLRRNNMLRQRRVGVLHYDYEENRSLIEYLTTRSEDFTRWSPQAWMER